MKNLGYVMASKKLVNEKLPVRFMYREKGSGDDSGWRFFSGTEDQAYTDNPDNIGIYDIKTIIAIDKTITPYLESIEGSAFERPEGLGTFNLRKAEKIHNVSQAVYTSGSPRTSRS